MELLPRSMGTRPRVALEVRPEGLVAARAEDGAGVMVAVSRGELRSGAMWPGLRPGNLGDRAAVVGAMRRALDGVAAKGGERSRYVTLVVPDGACRVLLLDFDALPGKAAEALAVVRFRLKKLLPFDAEHAVVSYQVMSSGRDGIRVLAVAMPCEVLSEYEGAVTEAGYLPGAVLPSTLAALACLESSDAGAAPALVVNAGPGAVTTAIVQGGVLLLHRTVELGAEGEPETGAGTPAGAGVGGSLPGDPERPPLAERERSAGEAARREMPDYDRMDAITEMQEGSLGAGTDRLRAAPGGGQPPSALPTEADEAVRVLNATEPISVGREVTQAVSVAAAYFEDTLGSSPSVVLAAGTMGAERMAAVLNMYGMEGLRVRDLVEGDGIGPGASASSVPRGWLTGVWGALRS